MKLILCLECQDVRKLLRDTTYCSCGKSHGRYLDDGLHAEIAGPCVPLGLGNSSLAEALRHKDTKSPLGHTFTAFVIPPNASTVKRVRKGVA